LALGGADLDFKIRDRLLLLHSCLDMGATKIIIGGKLSLYFLKAIGISVGATDLEIESQYLGVCKSILLEAK